MSEVTHLNVPAPRVRTRAYAWGGDSDRAALGALTDELRAMTGYGACALEVLRADSMLEFVAISDRHHSDEEWLGRASPLSAMEMLLPLGESYGCLTFIKAEAHTQESWEAVAPYSVIPDHGKSGEGRVRQAYDMLVARVVDETGELRGFLYLDEPEHGLRPTLDELRELDEILQRPLRSILAVLEKERLARPAQVAKAANRAIRTLTAEDGLSGFLHEAHAQLSEGFGAAELQIRLFDEELVGSVPGNLADSAHPGNLAALDRAAIRAWTRQSTVIAEPGEVWGDERLGQEIGSALDDHLTNRGAKALVLTPVGAGGEALGYLLITRSHTRWTEAESSAAVEVGHDLGRAILNARAYAKEEVLVQELRDLDTYRSQLISTITHELKNPLTGITGHLELVQMMLEDLVLPESVRKSLAGMERSAARLSSLINSLLEFSKVGQPEAPLDATPVDLGVVCEDVIDSLTVQAVKQEISIQLSVAPECVVLGNESEVHRVVLNLVSNAVKYSDEGGSVSVTGTRDGETVTLVCADSGIGISPSDQQMLFTEFFRSGDKRARMRPGSGLGLSIVKRIVERHGGTITLNSVLNQGTTIKVTLPASTREHLRDSLAC